MVVTVAVVTVAVVVTVTVTPPGLLAVVSSLTRGGFGFGFGFGPVGAGVAFPIAIAAVMAYISAGLEAESGCILSRDVFGWVLRHGRENGWCALELRSLLLPSELTNKCGARYALHSAGRLYLGAQYVPDY